MREIVSGPSRKSELAALGPARRAFYSFRADDRLYGIDVTALREVSTHTVITPVPHAPAAIRGLVNLRSRILLVLDLRPLLQLPPAECSAESRLIVLKPSVLDDTGVLVDRGGDIIHVVEEQCEWIDDVSRSPEASPLIVGVCKLDEELMMVIDASRFADAIADLMK